MTYLRSCFILKNKIKDFDHDLSFFGFNGAPNFFVHFVAVTAQLRREKCLISRFMSLDKVLRHSTPVEIAFI